MIAAAPLRLRFPARPARLKAVRGAVRRAALAAGCDEGAARDVVMAVDEACQNIIRHAYAGSEGDIVIELRGEGGRVVVLLTDFAPPVDPSGIRPRPLDDLRPGGLGTHLMRVAMDEVMYLPPPCGAGNMLKMVKRIG